MASQIPRTRFARAGEVSIAYKVFGEGPIDIVYPLPWISHVEMAWQEPSAARFFERLGAIGRVMILDKRGTGLSDRDTGYPTLETAQESMKLGASEYCVKPIDNDELEEKVASVLAQ